MSLTTKWKSDMYQLLLSICHVYIGIKILSSKSTLFFKLPCSILQKRLRKRAVFFSSYRKHIFICNWGIPISPSRKIRIRNNEKEERRAKTDNERHRQHANLRPPVGWASPLAAPSLDRTHLVVAAEAPGPLPGLSVRHCPTGCCSEMLFSQWLATEARRRSRRRRFPARSRRHRPRSYRWRPSSCHSSYDPESTGRWQMESLHCVCTPGRCLRPPGPGEGLPSGMRRSPMWDSSGTDYFPRNWCSCCGRNWFPWREPVAAAGRRLPTAGSGGKRAERVLSRRPLWHWCCLWNPASWTTGQDTGWRPLCLLEHKTHNYLDCTLYYFATYETAFHALETAKLINTNCCV